MKFEELPEPIQLCSSKAVDLSGDKFGELTALFRVPSTS